MTDSLLFDWSELLTLEQPEFRYVNSQNGIKPNSYTQYAIPKDIADISRDRDINKLADILSVRLLPSFQILLFHFHSFRVKYKWQIILMNRTSSD